MNTFIVLDDTIYIEDRAKGLYQNVETEQWVKSDMWYLCAWSLSHTQIRVVSPHEDLLLDTLNVLRPLGTRRERIQALQSTIMHAPGEITVQSSHKLW